MIIDMHRHFVAKEWYSEYFWNGYARMVQRVASEMGMTLSIESIQTQILPGLFDTTGEKHLEQMEKAGIDKSAVFLFDTGLLTGEPGISIQEQNKVLFNVAKKYPDKFIPFAQIDPRRPGAIEFVKKCVEEWGAKGFKLHPSAGFNPEESETMKLIESIAGYGIPVITHSGHSPNPTSSRYCDPIYLEKMLLEYPGVNVIAAHMSLGYRQQLCTFAWYRPNLYTEISMSQFIIRKNGYPSFARAVREAVNAFGPDRVLFGTDFPWLESIIDGKDFIKAIKELATKAPDDAKFSESEIEMLLGLNAQKLLNI
jgi:predicted TIM-barrel fold metal-dependent hydrolase